MSSPPAINHAVILATTLAVLLSLAGFTNSLGSTAFAQGNQTATASSSSNQTGAQVTGQPETTVLNKTTVPFNQTMVGAGEANQTTGQQNQTGGGQQAQQQQANNATSSQPSASGAGGGGANQTQQQQQASNATSQPAAGGGGGGGTQEENQQTNTQGQGNDPLSQMGESLGNIFGQ